MRHQQNYEDTSQAKTSRNFDDFLTQKLKNEFFRSLEFFKKKLDTFTQLKLFDTQLSNRFNPGGFHVR